MQNKYEKMLEYAKIMDILSSHAITYLGKELCQALSPSFDNAIVQTRLMETDHAYQLLHKLGGLPLDEIPVIGLSLKNLESGLSLSCKELLEIATILRTNQKLRSYFSEDALSEEEKSYFKNWTDSLYVNPSIEQEIFSKILDENTLDDKASPTLSSIRRKIRSTEQAIKNKLNDFLHSSNYSKYIQEPVIMIRNGRYVIPVKEEYRSQIKGFIHDLSASGSTVFVEPLSVFEMNNELNHLHAEEQVEIQTILANLSNRLAPYTEALSCSITAIGNLDFLFSKASYAKSLNATLPILNQNKQIHLIAARHPLIDVTQVVPISLSLGKDFRTLVITGPNTGGKTVTLKTVGLICLMAYSGLFIPANENSTLAVFSDVFVDIGDEQSIQESLSTFSSHMVTIIEILERATENSLILLDELGSGTDPIEGSSLAISILETLFKRGALTISTTHYPEIKNYALVTKGFENASCEFDVENLKPTYRLLIGIPGKSNAFAISKRLGLKQDILDRATSFLNQDEIHMEEVLKSIYDDKIEIEKTKEEIQKSEQQITLLKKKLEQNFSDLTDKRNKIIEDAKIEARNLLLNAKETASQTIKKINQLSSTTSSTRELNQIRNNLNDAIKNTVTHSLMETVENEEEIKKGDFVLVTSLNQTGTVLSNPNKANQVQVQVGSTKMTLPITYLVLKEKPKKEKNSSHTSVQNSFKAKTATTEINGIGCNVEESLFLVDKFLDDASLAKLSQVRIVHGKGTGTLKNGIHTFLKKHPHVKSFRLGTFGEGEMGVTVVELK